MQTFEYTLIRLSHEAADRGEEVNDSDCGCSATL